MKTNNANAANVTTIVTAEDAVSMYGAPSKWSSAVLTAILRDLYASGNADAAWFWNVSNDFETFYNAGLVRLIRTIVGKRKHLVNVPFEDVVQEVVITLYQTMDRWLAYGTVGTQIAFLLQSKSSLSLSLVKSYRSRIAVLREKEGEEHRIVGVVGSKKPEGYFVQVVPVDPVPIDGVGVKDQTRSDAPIPEHQVLERISSEQNCSIIADRLHLSDTDVVICDVVGGYRKICQETVDEVNEKLTARGEKTFADLESLVKWMHVVRQRARYHKEEIYDAIAD